MSEPSNYTNVSKTFLIEVFSGVFFIIALGLLIFFTALIKGKDLFMSEKSHLVTIVFPSVGSLRVNDKVCVKGMEIGKVAKLTPGKYYRNIIVELALREEIPFYSDYSVSLRSSSVFGGYYVLLDPGLSKGEPIPKGELLRGNPPVDLISEASDLMRDFRETSKRLNEILIDGKFLENVSGAAKEFNDGAKKMNSLFDSFKTQDSLISKVMTDKAFADEFCGAVKNINSASVSFSAVLKDLQDGKGSMGKLLSKDDAYNKLVKALDDINKISDSLASSKGSLGKILGDDGLLYDNLNGSFKSFGDLAGKIQRGEGTVGKLVNDDSLYLEIKETVRQLRAAVEDFREQAPIATFGSMALGAL